MLNSMFRPMFSEMFERDDSSLIFVGSNLDKTPAAGTYTFSSEPIGAPHPNRWVIVAVSYVSSPQGIDGVTINGNAMTLVDEAFGNLIGVHMFKYNLADGDTADIAIDPTDAQMDTVGIKVYRLIHATGIEDQTASSVITSGTGPSLNMNILEGGDIIAASLVINDGTAFTPWSGVVEDDSVDIKINEIYASASATYLPAETNRTINAVTVAGKNSVGIAATWS